MMYDMVRQMHHQFGLEQNKTTKLSVEESEFRIKAMQEEIQEYIDADTLEAKLDALIDLSVFTLGTAARHGFDKFEDAFFRVMHSNKQKELAGNAKKSKRNFSADLIKPPGWREPYLLDLISPPQIYKGIILLEGPDHTGKTTLAEHLKANYGAHIMHCTWSEDLAPHMDDYITNTMENAMLIAQNQLVVIDRAWISEYIYDAVFRNQSSFEQMYTNMHRRFLTNEYGRYNGVFKLVYCLPYNKEDYLKQFNAGKQQREEMYDTMDTIFSAYETLWDGIETFQFKNKSYYARAFPGLAYNPSSIRYDYRRPKMFEHLVTMLLSQFKSEKTASTI